MSVSAAWHVQTVVIGAGVIGLAAARAIAATGREVLIIERDHSIGQGTSSRNSEVIHAGIYYPPQFQPLKARLCVRGKELMYKYCADHNVNHKRIQKLIVATNESQLQKDLPSIVERAEANGVTDLRLLSRDDVRSIEPEIVCTGALLSPSTGIISSHMLMLELLGDAEKNGATLALNCPVKHVKILEGSGSHGKLLVEAEAMDLSCDHVINCAGLFADKVAAMVFGSAGKDIVTTNSPRQYFAKGNYYKLEGQRSPFSHLIYPVPEEGGLGVHATIDLGASIRFGPDVEWVDEDIENPDDIDLSVDIRRADSFYAEVRKYWPGLLDDGLVPDYAGIRPKCVPMGSKTKGDFIIEGPNHHGVPGFVNLLGIESPGLTACMAIAEDVVRLIEES